MNDGIYWAIAIALFWIAPVFVAAWLGDVKRSSSTEAPWAWGLAGWVGTLVFGLKRPQVTKNAELARLRSRLVVFASLVGICAMAGFAVYASELQKVSIDPNESARLIIQRNINSANPTTPTEATSASCVKIGTRRWQCVVNVASEGTVIPIGGELVCDDANCLWEPST